MEEQVVNKSLRGFAAAPVGKSRPFRGGFHFVTRLRRRALRRGLDNLFGTVSSLTAVCCGKAARASMLMLVLSLIAAQVSLPALPAAAQRRSTRSGAHATAPETFTAADRSTVERAIGSACAERFRDPLGSTPIDVMQARPSMSVNHPDAVAGAKRANRLLSITKKLVSNEIVQMAKEYGMYSGVARTRVNAAAARVQAVKQVRPSVDARDNASVLLRDPRAIEFGTIFLAGLRSDEAMISVLAHELTHVASGQSDSLRPLFRAIGRRAAARTGLRIQGQRAEELACDLVGVDATRAFIRQVPSWEPLPRRLARTVAHNCVDDDSSDEDHLSPRNTIRALFSLDLDLARELLGSNNSQAFLNNPPVVDSSRTRFLRSAADEPVSLFANPSHPYSVPKTQSQG